MDRIIFLSANLKCNSKVAFEMFTVNDHLENWLTEMADVEPEVGGKYELFWNPLDEENDSTIGCKILAIEPSRFLSFEWKGPKQFKHFMNNVRPLTNVVVSFIPDQDSTTVYVLHVGWRNTAEWENARQWFVKAWEDVLLKLQNYVSRKPG
ncbi:MAG: SRPBCC domain-containing protein [Promethearchaeota archaeon]